MLTLSGLKSCLMQRKCASLLELSLHLDSDRDAVRHALQHFETKGVVRRLDGAAPCPCAKGCSCQTEEVWEWCG